MATGQDRGDISSLHLHKQQRTNEQNTFELLAHGADLLELEQTEFMHRSGVGIDRA